MRSKTRDADVRFRFERECMKAGRRRRREKTMITEINHSGVQRAAVDDHLPVVAGQHGAAAAPHGELLLQARVVEPLHAPSVLVPEEGHVAALLLLQGKRKLRKEALLGEDCERHFRKESSPL